jgi:hypothetical protein
MTSVPMIPPTPWGPLITGDDVGLEAEALVRRYQLLEALQNRRDLYGAPLDPILAAEMHRQLVSGVDFAFTGVDAGWRISPGVRLERLVYSPWLRDMALPTGAFRLPETATEFAEAFGARTGVTLDHSDAFQAIHRVTPLALGEVAMRLRGDAVVPSPHFLLLLSHHFDLLDADRAGPVLLGQPPRTAKWFKRPALHGFELLAEIEREALIGLDLARLATVGNLAAIRALLANCDEHELRVELHTSPNLRRLLGYALVQTASLASFDNAVIQQASPDPRRGGSWLAAAATGRVTATTGDVTTSLGQVGSDARKALIEAFATPKGQRTNALNGSPATFWGIDNQSLSRVARAQIGEEFRGGTRGIPGVARGYEVYEDRSALAQIILGHVDPVLAASIQHRADAQQAHKSTGNDTSLTNPQKQAQGYARYILPPAGAFGSAPRFQPSLWRRRYADHRFWQMMLGKELALFRLPLSARERAAVNNALRRLRVLFGTQDASPAEVRIAIKAACDLATGVSALSTNRHFVQDLRALLDALDKLNLKTTADLRDIGHRMIPGTGSFLKARRRVGEPPEDEQDP